MKVYVVDNGGQWTHREWRVLKYLDVDTKIVPNTTPFEELADVDALVLSGGAPSVAMEADAMGNNGEYLDKAESALVEFRDYVQEVLEQFLAILGMLHLWMILDTEDRALVVPERLHLAR